MKVIKVGRISDKTAAAVLENVARQNNDPRVIRALLGAAADLRKSTVRKN